MASNAQQFSLDRRWLLLRAILAVGAGIAAIFFPKGAAYAFTLLLGGYAAADGLAAFGSSVQLTGDRRRWLWAYAVRGGVGVLACILFVVTPGMMAVGPAFISLAIASTWAALAGFLEIIAALKLEREGQGVWLLVGAGLLSICLALAMPVVLFFDPTRSIGSGTLTIGLFLCAIGGLYALQAWRSGVSAESTHQ